MASESHDSRRKHRRSSSDDDEAEKSSKRHKHRHHYHRHRHRSKKHDEESKPEGEDINPTSLPLPLPPVANNSHLGDDVEEGEILEDEGFGGGEIAKKKFESEDEAGEIAAVHVRDESDKPNLGHCAEHRSSDREASLHMEESVGNKGTNSKTFGDDKSEDDLMIISKLDKEDKTYHQHHEVGFLRNTCVEPQDESRVGSKGHVNGDLGHESRKEEKKWLRESGSPSKGIGKLKSYYDDEKIEVEESILSNHRKSSSHSTEDRGEVHTRSRSRSIGARERSRSRSMREEEAHSKRRRYHDFDASLYVDKGKFEYDSDYERKVRRSRHGRHGSRDLVRDEERDRSISHSRYIGGEDWYRNWAAHDRERSMDRDMDKDLRREKELERVRDSEMDRAQRRDRDRDRDRGGSRDRARDMDRKRDIERDRNREREVGRDRRREKEREKNWDREVDRDGKREKESDRSRASERDRDRDREREKDRDKGRENERERRDDRSRNKDRGIVNDWEKYENLEDGYDNGRYKHSRRSRHDEKEYNQDRTRKSDPEKVPSFKSNPLEGYRDKQKRDEDDQGDYEEATALQFAEQEEEDLNRIKEESRRRRQAILEKYKIQQPQQPNEPQSEDVKKDKEPAHDPDQSIAANNVVPEVGDGRNDVVDDYVAEPSFSVGKSPPQNGVAAFEKTSGAGGLGEGTPKSERSDDKFCDDIFGETPTGVRKSGKGDGLRIERSGLHDNWDDAEGYYSYRFGETLDGRYEVIAAHGKGVFSTVVRAKNLKAGNGEPEEVAIKIIRSNDTMYKTGLEELVILKKLVGADPDDKRHCVRFLSSFKYRNHLCLVFESLHMNLREVLKKFGRNIGLKLTAVRAYAKQLFIALKHLRNCGVLHCDIKPDNMLVNEAKNVLKLCDFGNAMFAGKNEITPYLVSRFYRAPEIILGLPYDHPMDMWSVGCCLYELYTGKVLFPGPTNNDMLRLHMELKGPFPKKMLRKGAFTDQHFDHDLNFHATEEDPVTKKTIKRMIFNIKPKDIGSIVVGSPGEDPKMLANFKDLLEKVFVLDPDKRMTVSQALTHPFITGK